MANYLSDRPQLAVAKFTAHENRGSPRLSCLSNESALSCPVRRSVSLADPQENVMDLVQSPEGDVRPLAVHGVPHASQGPHHLEQVSIGHH